MYRQNYWHDSTLPGWHRRLAASVVRQALRDAADSHASATDRESARTFLAGSPMFRYWCHVGHLDSRGLKRL